MHHVHGCWQWACEWALFVAGLVRGLFRRRPPPVEPASHEPTILQFRLHRPDDRD